MLKNDALENGTSRIGLYGSAAPGSSQTLTCVHIICLQTSVHLRFLSNSIETLRNQDGIEEDDVLDNAT